MSNSSHLTFIGHATVLIEMDDVRLVTDPVLRNQIFHLRRQKKLIDPAVVRNIDAVLISHTDRDHLDIPSLKFMGDSTPMIVSPGTAPLLRSNGFQHVEELAIGESTSVGTVTIKATYADHGSNRLRHGARKDCLGYIIDGSFRTYFAGDTALFPEMAELAEDLDVALLPVWGWGPNLGPGHMNPYQAALAVRMLAPELAIPIHWGTFFPLGLGWMFPKHLIDPPHAFANFVARLAPEVKVKILSPGDQVLLE